MITMIKMLVFIFVIINYISFFNNNLNTLILITIFSVICFEKKLNLQNLCQSLNNRNNLYLPVYVLWWVCWTFTLCAVCRTLETPSAVSSGASSPSERRSPAVDFLLRPRASICSSCPTTARRASCVTNCATPSVWTRASSSPNSVAFGQSAQEACGKTVRTKREAQFTWTDSSAQ